MNRLVQTVQRAALVTAFSAGFAALSAQAPSNSPVRIGERVRVTVPSMGTDPIVGVVDSLRETVVVLDTAVHEHHLFLDPGPPTIDKFRRVSIPYDDIRTLEVSAGRSKKKGMIVGATIGAIVGAISFGFGNTPQYNPGWSDVKKGIPYGIAIGAPVGAAIGYLLGRERWHPVSVAKPSGSPGGASSKTN